MRVSVCVCIHYLCVGGRQRERPSHIFLMNELKIINSLPDAADVASTAYADKCRQGHWVGEGKGKGLEEVSVGGKCDSQGGVSCVQFGVTTVQHWIRVELQLK